MGRDCRAPGVGGTGLWAASGDKNVWRGNRFSTAVAAKLLTHAGEPAVICSYFDISEQKQIEKSLQVSEQRFRDFSQAGSDWFWESDINHRFNTYYSNVTKPPDEWGITRYERASLEDRESNPEKWRRHLRDLDAHRPFRDFVYSIKDSGKSRLWVRTSGLPVFDEAGKFAGYRGTGTDITNQVKAEQRARSAETRLFDAIERFSGSVVLFDADDCLMVANRQWREFNEKVAAATETGANWTDYFRALLDAGVFPDAIGREDEWFEQRAEMRRDPKGPQEFRRSDGGWVLIDDLRLPDDSTLSVATDITKQKSAEEALRESEQRRLDFAQAGSDWFWETDAEHRFLEAGKGDVIRPTSPAHPSIGNTRYENASPWDRARDPEKWKDHLRDLNEHRPFRNFEYAFDAPDGIRHWLRISGVPVPDKADKFTGYRGIATNITDEINTEERAKSAQQRFASAIENAGGTSDMIAVWDADMKFVVANKSFFAIHDTVNVRPHVGMDYGEIEYGVRVFTVDDGWGWIFSRGRRCRHVSADRFGAGLYPPRPARARGLALRMDHGSQYLGTSPDHSGASSRPSIRPTPASPSGSIAAEGTDHPWSNRNIADCGTPSATS